MLVSSRLAFAVPEGADTGSIDRMRHLLTRMAATAQAGYVDYVQSENSLSDTTPLGMARIASAYLGKHRHGRSQEPEAKKRDRVIRPFE